MFSDIHNLQQENELWEMMWSPYDQQTYQQVLESLSPDDIVLEIGAGDLRLSQMIARRCKYVYAIEIQKEILEKNRQPIPDNLTIINDDARNFPFPSEISAGILLMRHCTHFQLYANKLKSVGCRRLITNARWRLSVEVVELQTKKMSYQMVDIGWFACLCGAVGFHPGPVDAYTPEVDAHVHQVSDCPYCANHL